MDSIQVKVIEAIELHKDCIYDRNKLKGILSDYLMDDRIHINILLNAFDEGFLSKIVVASDRTLTAIRFIKTLVDNYGISEEKAKWSIETWCACAGYEDITEALSALGNFGKNDSSKKTTSNMGLDESVEYDLGLGTYCAGVDFPAGNVSLTAMWKKGEKDVIKYGIGNTPDIKKKTEEFTDKTYIRIENGSFITITLNNMGYRNDLKTLKAKKIGD